MKTVINRRGSISYWPTEEGKCLSLRSPIDNNATALVLLRAIPLNQLSIGSLFIFDAPGEEAVIHVNHGYAGADEMNNISNYGDDDDENIIQTREKDSVFEVKILNN